MQDPRIYPLTFTPALRDYVWGGRRLETLYGRALPPGIAAESWEISGHPVAPTAADAGYWAGQPLPAILAELGEALAGTRASWALARDRFPLLVKLLDAHQDLSVQVHPDDAYALAHDGDLGKTEMWYVLHAEPGAELILGSQPGTTRESLAEALRMANGESQVANEAGRAALEALLRRVPVRAGDAIAIPTGTVHALLAGIVVTEIQQSSDATYRVYDWGRAGADGQPRPLHIAKALDVIDFDRPAPGIVQPRLLADAGGVRRAESVHHRYFVVEEIRLETGKAYAGRLDGSTLEIWGCLAGKVTAEWAGAPAALSAIRYTLLPAALGEFRVIAAQPSTCLRVYLPEV